MDLGTSKASITCRSSVLSCGEAVDQQGFEVRRGRVERTCLLFLLLVVVDLVEAVLEDGLVQAGAESTREGQKRVKGRLGEWARGVKCYGCAWPSRPGFARAGPRGCPLADP